MRLLIQGISCSGKTTFGDKLSQEHNLGNFVAFTNNKRKFKRIPLWKMINLSYFYDKIGFFYHSSLFLKIAQFTFKKCLKQSKSPNPDNSVQVSLRIIRVLSSIYVVSKPVFYELLKTIDHKVYRFDKSIILLPNYEYYRQRIKQRGYGIYLFDGITFLSANYFQDYQEGTLLAIKHICSDTKVISVDDYQQAYQEMKEFFFEKQKVTAKYVLSPNED
ncbi:MAG: hypothetical protein ACRCXZ_03330 [Patescibacteria group bacterium]